LQICDLSRDFGSELPCEPKQWMEMALLKAAMPAAALPRDEMQPCRAPSRDDVR
jgi:hypothetical protein